MSKGKNLTLSMLLAGWISLTAVPGSIIICSPLLIDWKHILVQSPSPISFVKVIAWLNKECGDQVNLLPGFDSTIFLWPCSCVFCHYVFELCLFCFVEECLALSSFGWIVYGFLCFVYLRLRFILYMAFCQSKILCSSCTPPARLWCLNNIRIFPKKNVKREKVEKLVSRISIFSKKRSRWIWTKLLHGWCWECY